MYESASGQIINFQKSTITINPNMSEDGQAFVSNSLGLSEEVSHDLYLGLHSFMGRNRRKLFDSIKERVWNKLQVWWSKSFSFGGREILIKAVAQTTSTYAMSVFKILSTVCDAF